MGIAIYEKPLPGKRPYKSYRFDVFSLKAGRRMTLYGKAMVSQFIELEADHEVSGLCERPLVIPDLKPERLVDFWALRGGRPNFYLLVNTSAGQEAKKLKPAMEDFRDWVAGIKGVLHEVPVDSFHESRVFQDNWSSILQHLVAHRGQVTPPLIERLAIELPASATLSQLEGLMPDVDAMLVRAAVFTLLAEGRLRCPKIDSQLLHPATTVVRQ